MFKRIVTLVRGLMGCQSTAHSMSAVEQPLANAKPLRAKSTRISPNVQVVVSPKPKRKAKAALLTTQEASPKPVKKSAPKTLGQSGKSKTPVRQTRQAVLTQPNQKQKPAESTKVVKKATQGKTPAQTPTGRK